MAARRPEPRLGALGALGGVVGLAAARCGGGACSACFACAVPGVGLVLLAVLRRPARREVPAPGAVCAEER